MVTVWPLAIVTSSAAVGTKPHDQMAGLPQLPEAIEVQRTRGFCRRACAVGTHSKGFGGLSDCRSGASPAVPCANPNGCWMKPVCFVRSAARSSASAAAWAASSSSENGDTTAGCTVAACGAPAGAGLTTTLRLPPRDGADLKPDASSTADIDISDRARII